MRTYKMTISYDGTRYQGWQRQAMTDNTIQHILEWTIGRMVGYRTYGQWRACTWSGGQREAVEAVRCGRPEGCIEPFIAGRYTYHPGGTGAQWIPRQKEC